MMICGRPQPVYRMINGFPWIQLSSANLPPLFPSVSPYTSNINPPDKATTPCQSRFRPLFSALREDLGRTKNDTRENGVTIMATK